MYIGFSVKSNNDLTNTKAGIMSWIFKSQQDN